MMMSTAASIFTITVLFTLLFVTNVESVPHKGSRSLAVAADGARTLTNGERFARGLPPNKPIRRRSRMFAVLCWLMVFDFVPNSSCHTCSSKHRANLKLDRANIYLGACPGLFPCCEPLSYNWCDGSQACKRAIRVLGRRYIYLRSGNREHWFNYVSR